MHPEPGPGQAAPPPPVSFAESISSKFMVMQITWLRDCSLRIAELEHTSPPQEHLMAT